MSQDTETAPGPAPAPTPWVSTQHEMENAARPGRTRVIKVRLPSGVHRVAQATYAQATTSNAAGTAREHLYRISLHWLAELDTRDGRAERVPDRGSPNRPTNALQFRVLETTNPDGRRSTIARLGPKGQIAAEPKGIGLTGFLRAALVEWVAERHPDAVVVGGTLPRPDGQTEVERVLRDRFLEGAGFKVEASSDGTGRYLAAPISQLKRSWNAEKVVEIDPPATAEALGAQLESVVLRKRVAALETEINALAKERRNTQVMSRIWLALAILGVVFGIVFGIQPRIA